MKFVLTPQEAEKPLVATLEVDSDGDLNLLVGGQRVLFIDAEDGRVARWCNSRLAELGFELENDKIAGDWPEPYSLRGVKK